MEYAILRDCDHPLLDSGAAEVVGEHDNPTDDPHCHYSILTIENGLVTNVDWGYHTEDEAREHLPYRPPTWARTRARGGGDV